MYTRFFASQSVELAVPDESVSIRHYLRKPKRLVDSLTCSSQILQLSEEYFRLKMRPLTFMIFSLQPTVDMRVWAGDNGTIHLQSVACEIRGIEYINQRFAFNLVGKLYAEERHGLIYLSGKADLEVKVEVPPPLNLTPRPILETSGNTLLASVLLTIKQRLMNQLLLHYRQWARSQATVSVYSPQEKLSAISY
ncbi:MAG: DUF1997 domain-containing protein [Hormoscilla sp.]